MAEVPQEVFMDSDSDEVPSDWDFNPNDDDFYSQFEFESIGNAEPVPSTSQGGGTPSSASLGELLHVALEEDDGDWMLLLLKNGADASATNAESDTALHVCLRKGGQMAECVRELVRHGADVSHLNNHGKSPGRLALELGWRRDIIELLILDSDRPEHRRRSRRRHNRGPALHPGTMPGMQQVLQPPPRPLIAPPPLPAGPPIAPHPVPVPLAPPMFQPSPFPFPSISFLPPSPFPPPHSAFLPPSPFPPPHLPLLSAPPFPPHHLPLFSAPPFFPPGHQMLGTVVPPEGPAVLAHTGSGSGPAVPTPWFLASCPYEGLWAPRCLPTPEGRLRLQPRPCRSNPLPGHPMMM